MVNLHSEHSPICMVQLLDKFSTYMRNIPIYVRWDYYINVRLICEHSPICIVQLLEKYSTDMRNIPLSTLSSDKCFTKNISLSVWYKY